MEDTLWSPKVSIPRISTGTHAPGTSFLQAAAARLRGQPCARGKSGVRTAAWSDVPPRQRHGRPSCPDSGRRGRFAVALLRLRDGIQGSCYGLTWISATPGRTAHLETI